MLIVNSSEEIVKILQQLFQQEHFTALTLQLDDVRSGRVNFPEFLRLHDPRAVIWDIPPPYEENWTFLALIRELHSMKGRSLVVTTTNKKRLDELVGKTETVELVGKPFDLNELIDRVRKTVQ